MRVFPVLALLMLTACMSAPQTEVTKNSPTDASIGAALPPMQGFVPTSASAPQRSNTQIAADFLDLEFRMESGRSLPAISRFDGPINISLNGSVPGTARADLARLVNRFRAEAGLDVRVAEPGSDASIAITFAPRAELQRLVPTAACFVVPRVSTLAKYKAKRNSPVVDWANLVRRDHVAIFMPSDTSPQEVRDCLHEEVAQAMGPLNDLYSLPDSVFNDDNFHTVLTGFDMLILRLHYAPEIANGMNEAETAARLPALLARLNPAGEFVGGAPARLSPRAWNDAVADAFGPGISQSGRLSAARRMLGIAAAQGWRDSRLGFAHFAVGRLSMTTDPQAAIAAFAEANRVYRSLPGTAIHSAHVDMQLAAISLASGQPEQAIGFADRAMPAVRQAENAALLATLMLMKSEALDQLGRSAEARALRLDSLGWARYGFGAEHQVRARMSEVANLASRGNRS